MNAQPSAAGSLFTTLQRGFWGKNSVTHSYALACRDVHENPQEREVRQETKTKKPRNCLRGLDFPYFMGNFLTDGAEERTPSVGAPLFSDFNRKT
jgi:hypothetical protein